MRELQTYKHWKMKTDKDGILWLTLDREDASVNSMNREVFTEFSKVLDEIAAQNPVAVILQSGKKKGFTRRCRHQTIYRFKKQKRIL